MLLWSVSQRLQMLRGHVKIHTGEKLFACMVYRRGNMTFQNVMPRTILEKSRALVRSVESKSHALSNRVTINLKMEIWLKAHEVVCPTKADEGLWPL